jgi:hypothetical protein
MPTGVATRVLLLAVFGGAVSHDSATAPPRRARRRLEANARGGGGAVLLIVPRGALGSRGPQGVAAAPPRHSQGGDWKQRPVGVRNGSSSSFPWGDWKHRLTGPVRASPPRRVGVAGSHGATGSAVDA